MVKSINEVKVVQDGPKISYKPPVLNLHVKILFDEDLKTMVFPKI